MKLSLDNINLENLLPISERRENELFNSNSQMTSGDGVILLYRVETNYNASYYGGYYESETLTINMPRPSIKITPALGIVKVLSVFGETHYRIWTEDVNVVNSNSDRSINNSYYSNWIYSRPEFDNLLFRKTFTSPNEISEAFVLANRYSEVFGIEPVEIKGTLANKVENHDVAICGSYTEALSFIKIWKEEYLPKLITERINSQIKETEKIVRKYEKMAATAKTKVDTANNIIARLNEIGANPRNATLDVDLEDKARPIQGTDGDDVLTKAIQLIQNGKVGGKTEYKKPTAECKFADKCIFGPNSNTLSK